MATARAGFFWRGQALATKGKSLETKWLTHLPNGGSIA